MSKIWQESDKAKDRLFNIMDRIEKIKQSPFPLSFEEECLLKTLEIQKMQEWSNWKDPD